MSRTRRAVSYLLSAALVTAGATAVLSGPATAAVPSGGMAAADLNAMFGTYGDAGGHWTGGDSTTSVPLPDGRVAWLFSDTFLGTVNSDGSRPKPSPMVHNTIVVQDGTSLVSTLTGGTAGVPDALVKPGDSGQYYWVGDGTVEGNSLKVLYNSYKQSGSGNLDFTLTGTALATFALPGLTLTSVTDLGLGSVIGWGSAILEDGSYTYIYGTSSTSDGFKFGYVARAPAGGLSGAWQFWTGSAWSGTAADAAPVLSGVGTGFGVQKVGSGYLLVTQQTNLPFDPDYVGYPASSPTGPFGAPVPLFTAPEVTSGSAVISYDARVHPELARSGKVLVSYNVNSLSNDDNYANARLYRPRFVEVDWPPAAPDPSKVPAAVSTLTASTDDSGAAHLSWSAVSGATQYRVYQRDVSAGQTYPVRLTAPVTGTSTDLGGLRTGHTYEYQVTAQNGVGEGPPSPTASVTAHIQPPPAPTGLTATADTNGQIALSWQPVPAAWNYDIYRRDVTNGDTDFGYVTRLGGNQTTYTDGWLSNNDTYEYYVTATHGGGTSPISATAQATAHYAPPGAPTGLTATANADGTIALTWTAPGPNVWFNVYQRDATAGETEFTQLPLPVTTCCAMTAGYLTNGHTYEFRVTATNSGGESAASNTASAASTYPRPAKPGTLTVTPGDGQAVLTWTASSTPDAWYLVYQRDVTAGETAFTQLPLPITECCTMNAAYLANGHTYEFYVVATSAGGASDPTATVSVTPQIPLPGQVTGLSATAQTDGSITLTWTAPSANLWYDVYERDVTAGDTGFTKLPLPVTTCCTFNAGLLTNKHVYQFRIAPTNAAGAGPLSAVVQATSAYSPPAAPTNLRGTAAGDATINLDWDPPGNASYYYWVYYRDVTAGQTAFTKSAYPTQNSWASLGLLANGHTYEYKVTAENQGGEGPASATVRVTAYGGLPAAPSNLTATAGDGQVTLHWTASATANILYTVYQRDTTTGQSWQKLPLPVNGTSMTAAYLTNGHTYQFKVVATNSAGESAPSNVASARPLPPIPAAPTNLAASAGDGKVSLSWTASSTPNVYYWIELRANGGAWRRLPDPISTCCSFTVSLLANGTTYEFRMFANNLAGDSTGTSNVVSARPMPPFPQPPTNLSATAGDGKVTLKWTASPTANVWYWIEMRAHGGSWQRLPYPYTKCCTTPVLYLTNGTTYDFRLRATNLSGDSDPSNVATARPMPPFPTAPTSVTTSGGTALVNLRWTPSSTAGVSYWIYYRDGTRGDRTWSRTVWSTTTSSAVLYGMFTNGDVYEFQVAAFNITGEARSGTVIEVPHRTLPSSSPTHWMNFVNGANALAGAWALARSESCQFDYLQTVCFGKPPSLTGQPVTIGDVLFFNGNADSLETRVADDAKGRYELIQTYGRAVADAKGPNLLRHEAVHSQQWANYLAWAWFVRDYGAYAAASQLAVGNPICQNLMELTANLYWGGYMTYPSGDCQV